MFLLLITLIFKTSKCFYLFIFFTFFILQFQYWFHLFGNIIYSFFFYTESLYCNHKSGSYDETIAADPAISYQIENVPFPFDWLFPLSLYDEDRRHSLQIIPHVLSSSRSP